MSAIDGSGGQTLAGLGRTIRRHREQQNMRVEHLAEAVGIEPKDLRAIEAGELDPPYVLLCDVADALGVRGSVLVAAAPEA